MRRADEAEIAVVLGSIPIAGDVFDAYFKANMRNLRILKDALGAPD